ncbi:MAG: ABC transporter permease [Vicinamibacterales bacterium]
MAGLLKDVTLALRTLRGSPGFALFAVVSLALGIGVTTVVYSGVRTLLWRPLGVPHAETLMGLRNGRLSQAASWLDFEDLRTQQTSFRAVAASITVTTAIGAGTGSRTVDAGAVSGEYFTVVGVRPRFGRLLTDADEAVGARVVVVSEAFWRTSLHADPAAVGRVIKVGGEPFEVVGVVEGAFHGLQSFFAESLWFPATTLPGDSDAFGATRALLEQRGSPWFAVWGRLRQPGAFGRASAEVALIGERLQATYPQRSRRQWRLVTDAAAPPDNDPRDSITLMILAGIGAVLLIACTNLANLSLAKGTARAQETAVRYALGASRWRLVREQLIESLFIVGVGGVVGAVVAIGSVQYWAVDLSFAPGVSIHFPEIDPSVFSAGLGGMALAALVFGLWPALQSTRSDVRSAIGAGLGATPAKWRLHQNIIAWQVCGSAALLLVALLAVKVIAGLGHGVMVRTEHGDLALAEVDFRLNGKNEAQMRALTAAILDTTRAQAGVRSVAASNGLPFGWRIGARETVPVSVDERVADPQHAASIRIIAASPAFFSTVGMRVLKGRGFTDQDDAGAPLVAILNEASARQLFHATDVIGRTVYLGTSVNGRASRSTTASAVLVVGVCNDERPLFSDEKPDETIFVPFAQRYQKYAPITFVARAETPALGVAQFRSSVQRVDPDLAIMVAGTGRMLFDGPLLVLRIIIAMTAVLGILALVLSMAGLFGVLSHVVNKRTREVGIRLAIGAGRADIFRLVLRDGLRPVVKGLVLGLTIGVAARIAVRAWVVTDVAAVDPLPLLLLPIPFAIAGFLASYLPAARASRVDPNVALRDL